MIICGDFHLIFHDEIFCNLWHLCVQVVRSLIKRCGVNAYIEKIFFEHFLDKKHKLKNNFPNVHKFFSFCS